MTDGLIEAKHAIAGSELKCSHCGGTLAYSAEKRAMQCVQCSTCFEVRADRAAALDAHQEQNFEEAIRAAAATTQQIDVAQVKCKTCGASTALDANVASELCPFCATPLVVKTGTTAHIFRPQAILPFGVDRERARDAFGRWTKTRWFAPNALKKITTNDEFKGLYIPYWTFDSDTTTRYTGSRGEYYWETERYTTTENGKTVTRTRQVRKTRWYPASGNVENSFDDVLVVASRSLPDKYVNALEPWDLHGLLPFDERYLSGFRTEIYQIELRDAFPKAGERMDPIIRQTIHRDIGGDEQRIDWLRVSHRNVTFKHVLLPIWLSAYRYGDKVYRVMVNGRTGETQGERPYSLWKIGALVVFLLALAAGIWFFAQRPSTTSATIHDVHLMHGAVREPHFCQLVAPSSRPRLKQGGFDAYSHHQVDRRGKSHGREDLRNERHWG